MAARLEGKVALISGVNGGIGGAVARAFASEGAAVMCTGIDVQQAAAVADEIERSGGRAAAMLLDVTSEADWETAIDATRELLGVPDVLVNNAGLLLLESLVDTTLEDFRRIHAVNVEGTFLGMRAAARVMRPGGAIINISSVSATKAASDHVAYGSSKAAVSAMTRHAASECAELGIRVNAICPGVVRTGMLVDTPENIDRVTAAHPLGIGNAEDVAAAAVYLASDAAKWITGAELTVDGGLSVRP